MIYGIFDLSAPHHIYWCAKKPHLPVWIEREDDLVSETHTRTIISLVMVDRLIKRFEVISCIGSKPVYNVIDDLFT